MTQHSLSGCVAVVTGASRGIGRATALQRGEAGAHLVLVVRTQTAWVRSQELLEIGSELHSRFQWSDESGSLDTPEQSASSLIPRRLTTGSGQIWTADSSGAAAQRVDWCRNQ
ncbi:SDR family NAD(P)-dependent oxidoreductase [Diaminobutyricibacter tongyongensis]|uniref:SDR family NAD(P)-dependent oxidoreductase n=1 Tax=Leifsonia tongyongensis TaxID=1268043 RepID=A0A6L9Y2Y3_9MICO|nr:SDR family NAD(P)-dependent oxidoreductase [Diaminobutyricibacter tongyongensis]